VAGGLTPAEMTAFTANNTASAKFFLDAEL
jgi:hypothetical protein